MEIEDNRRRYTPKLNIEAIRAESQDLRSDLRLWNHPPVGPIDEGGPGV